MDQTVSVLESVVFAHQLLHFFLYDSQWPVCLLVCPSFRHFDRRTRNIWVKSMLTPLPINSIFGLWLFFMIWFIIHTKAKQKAKQLLCI